MNDSKERSPYRVIEEQRRTIEPLANSSLMRSLANSTEEQVASAQLKEEMQQTIAYLREQCSIMTSCRQNNALVDRLLVRIDNNPIDTS
uniref:AlNc14C108G6293 protein n=1 Tax=Albugo laibachii Nc14 TaxID=890382 RepID=F0WI86_9STRA|nr:AlNc14C108G6293 [Albugo laibachii Nc14]|eukprot:CCA20965.1 AlNc14C108G6293 [Albugo laibachii Nc14]